MPEATRVPSTRRAAFGIAAVLPLLGGAAVAARPRSLDAALVAMCDEMIGCEAEANAIEEPYSEGRAPTAKPLPAEQARIDAQWTRYREMFNEIAETPATTDAGKRAKARVCMSRLSFDLDGELLDEADAVLASLLDDLIGEARA